MHVGMSTFFQNLAGGYTDQEVYAHEIAMAGMAEPLGFDSIWAAMCPNVAQFLTYMAGRTKRVGVGSMVVAPVNIRPQTRIRS
ncbi:MULTISPECIES: LLM class flavin-dependent oxidoreductase [Alphaproteobacteria]|jgi:alkanesulfonate monooxygenase SsuD/methylene tetrahydromethanopterin reductase-like flavin-dependent oxidoreductase (luciferase family)|uniref:LLM class flavin-dependent oxidoreductase n=1 Tax=Alphaproteobacteria TaxID=28211 RepID=UPI0025D70B7A|nr:LLM class flavin-dependent oxidoreductase [Parvibaculum sp.]MDX5366576.1 LLM class flavin-dependent oxidoreductase [Alphaproteobacteria bacterium]MDX5416457.1 LLM class flavin-dependent oxidoreductase [Alphaproteobacteria bacterium]MDX5493805.1 LLM class flavin-dependent oxidoreductase [Alphaproteobacteria bacterium]|tara:strand:- start:931 stop:1179 length:249 start_codon:yes stop_codon:yes gene_type:complete